MNVTCRRVLFVLTRAIMYISNCVFVKMTTSSVICTILVLKRLRVGRPATPARHTGRPPSRQLDIDTQSESHVRDSPLSSNSAVRSRIYCTYVSNRMALVLLECSCVRVAVHFRVSNFTGGTSTYNSQRECKRAAPCGHTIRCS